MNTRNLQLSLPAHAVRAILQWRDKKFLFTYQRVVVQAQRFVQHYHELSHEARQYLHVCPQCFLYQEVACAPVVPATCADCGVRMRYAPEFVLEVILTDLSESEKVLM